MGGCTRAARCCGERADMVESCASLAFLPQLPQLLVTATVCLKLPMCNGSNNKRDAQPTGRYGAGELNPTATLIKQERGSITRAANQQ